MIRSRKMVSLLESARQDRRGNFREYFHAPGGQTVLCESAVEYKWWEGFAGAFERKELRADEFSFKDVFEQSIPGGHDILEHWKRGEHVDLKEAAGATSVTSFNNITGQIVYNKFMEEYASEQFTFTNLIPTITTQFDGERIPGIGGIGDQAEIVTEAQEYPYVGVTEDWIDTPRTVKRGMIAPITKEALFFDRTAMILRSAGQVGYFLGVNKEKRAIDVVIDENSTAGRYKWRGTSYATYATSGGHGIVNKQTSNALVDYTDIDAAELLLSKIVDPTTGEPVMVMADTLIVAPELLHKASQALQATSIVVHEGGYATTGTLSDRVSPNTIGGIAGYSGIYTILTSRLLPGRLATDTHWFLGNPRRAFAYMENFPLAVVQAPAGSEDEFKRDIVTQFKASERGAFATLDPRYMVQNTVA